MKLGRIRLFAGILCLALPAVAQPSADRTFSRLNTFTAFAEYSNDSSHIILGTTENRKIGALGFQYQRRLVHRPLLDLSYTAEIRPAMLESDPDETETNIETLPISSTSSLDVGAVGRCNAGVYPYSFTFTSPLGPPETFAGKTVISCSRRTVVEQGFSPAGIRINLLPRHRLQPTFSTFGGYMFSTQEVPVPAAGSFNYTFEFGAGLELFRAHSSARSVRLEYQVQHFSNKNTANANPGVDSGFVKLTYAFGR